MLLTRITPFSTDSLKIPQEIILYLEVLRQNESGIFCRYPQSNRAKSENYKIDRIKDREKYIIDRITKFFTDSLKIPHKRSYCCLEVIRPNESGHILPISSIKSAKSENYKIDRIKDRAKYIIDRITKFFTDSLKIPHKRSYCCLEVIRPNESGMFCRYRQSNRQNYI